MTDSPAAEPDSEPDADDAPEQAPEPRAPARPATNDEPVLPTQTSDDVDSDWRDRQGGDSDDERYLRERPPHWE